MISGYTGDILAKNQKTKAKAIVAVKRQRAKSKAIVLAKRQTGGHNNFEGTEVSLVAVSLELHSC